LINAKPGNEVLYPLIRMQFMPVFAVFIIGSYSCNPGEGGLAGEGALVCKDSNTRFELINSEYFGRTLQIIASV